MKGLEAFLMYIMQIRSLYVYAYLSIAYSLYLCTYLRAVTNRVKCPSSPRPEEGGEGGNVHATTTTTTTFHFCTWEEFFKVTLCNHLKSRA